VRKEGGDARVKPGHDEGVCDAAESLIPNYSFQVIHFAATTSILPVPVRP